MEKKFVECIMKKNCKIYIYIRISTWKSNQEKKRQTVGQIEKLWCFL